MTSHGNTDVIIEWSGGTRISKVGGGGGTGQDLVWGGHTGGEQKKIPF